MNTRQRVVLCVGLVIVAAMCAVPPWGNIGVQDGVRWFLSPAGYGPVFAPQPVDASRGLGISPDFGRLGLQVLAVAALCGSLVLATGGRGKDGGA